MKALILYDSTFGNTKKIAQLISKTLGAELKQVSEVFGSDLKDYDLLVIGSPIIGWKPSENMGNFLSNLGKDQLFGTKVATFDTRVKLFIHGDAANKISKSLEDAGAEVILGSEFFYVKGTKGPLFDSEEAKAVSWANKIKNKIQQHGIYS